DRSLTLVHLLERARELRFDGFPLGEPLLELRHALLREPQTAGAVVELIERRRQLDEAIPGRRNRATELPRALFELLRGTRRLLTQLRHPVQVLRRFVQRGPFEPE